MVNQSQAEDLTIRVPITTAMREQAEALAQGLPSAAMAARIYRNTLAMLVVNAYLQWQGYTTEVAESTIGQPGTRLAGGDAADLPLSGLGRVECRPVLPDARDCLLPPEAWHNRIGYVIVQIEPDVKEAVLLGFLPPFDPEDPLESVELTDLQSMDAWIDYLDRLERGAALIATTASPEAEQVRQLWVDPDSRLMLIAQLERIYRSEPRSKWRVKGEKMLSGRVLEGAVVREEALPADRLELQGVAERLLEQLAVLWNV